MLGISIKVLLALRDGKATDFQSLYKEIFRLPSVGPIVSLVKEVQKLESVGLVILDTPLPDDPLSKQLFIDSFPIRISPNWSIIQESLGISLNQLLRVNTGEVVLVNPLYGRPRTLRHDESADIFVLMPFKEEFRPVYDDHIKKVATKLKTECRRADDFFNVHAVMEDVWAGICGARVIIADCTGRNPNVFYETGLAHAIGKPVILMAQSIEDVPFDIRHLRFLKYEYNPRGMKKFEEELLRTLTSELSV